MSKLALIALLGCIVLAAAVDVEPLKKKHYDDDDDSQHGGHKDNSYVYLQHKHWTWGEEVGPTFPCDSQFEILGSTVTQFSDILDGGREIGSVSWSGTVVEHELCKECKNYESTGHHIVRVNYEVIFDIKGKGQIIGLVNGGSIFATEAPPVAIVGGTGDYKGVKGVVQWTYADDGKANTYEFKVFFPRVHDKDYKGSYEKDEYEYRY